MKILVVSDLHCGHMAGLGPHDTSGLFDWYMKTTTDIGKVDVCIANGDLIDGRGEKTGGTELLLPDRLEQCELAMQCLRWIRADRWLFTYGTAYHTGKYEDWERLIAKEFKGEIADNLRVNLGGKVFNVRHHVGRSTIPHGQATPLIKEAMWDRLNGRFADFYIRSHVHYFQCIQNQFGVQITTPALQRPGSKFGARRCTGNYDIGMVLIEDWQVKPILYSLA